MPEQNDPPQWQLDNVQEFLDQQKAATPSPAPLDPLDDPNHEDFDPNPKVVFPAPLDAHINDGRAHDRAMAWSDGYSEGFDAGMAAARTLVDMPQGDYDASRYDTDDSHVPDLPPIHRQRMCLQVIAHELIRRARR